MWYSPVKDDCIKESWPKVCFFIFDIYDILYAMNAKSKPHSCVVFLLYHSELTVLDIVNVSYINWT